MFVQVIMCTKLYHVHDIYTIFHGFAWDADNNNVPILVNVRKTIFINTLFFTSLLVLMVEKSMTVG